jgi:hypothetical protein
MYSDSFEADSEPVSWIVSFDVEYSVEAGVLLEIGAHSDAALSRTSQAVLTFTVPFWDTQAVPEFTVLLKVSVPFWIVLFGFEPSLFMSAYVLRAVTEPMTPTAMRLRRSFLIVRVDTTAYWSMCQVSPNVDSRPCRKFCGAVVLGR